MPPTACGMSHRRRHLVLAIALASSLGLAATATPAWVALTRVTSQGPPPAAAAAAAAAAALVSATTAPSRTARTSSWRGLLAMLSSSSDASAAGLSRSPLLPARPFVVYVTPGVPADDDAGLQTWYRKIQECAEAGVPLVQIRDKRLDGKALLPHARKARQLIDAANGSRSKAKTLLLLNGNVEAARESGADGVHLPEAMVGRAPELRGQREEARAAGGGGDVGLVGSSVHSVEAALKAARLGVDYLQVGTMFLTGSHPEKLEVEGPALMREIHGALTEAGLRDRLALVGVGGITATNCGQVIEAGADGVAAISGLAAPERDVGATVAGFQAAMAEACRRRR